MVTVPATQPETESAESTNESGIPQSTTEGNGALSVTTAAPEKKKDEKFGFYKENGEYETDPAKIAAAFVMKNASSRATGQPFGARYPEYIHPESGVSTENISLLDEKKAKPTLTPAIKVTFKGANGGRFGLDRQKKGAKFSGSYGGYETEGEIRPRGLNWTGEEKTRSKHEGQYFENLVMPAALKIAEIHQKLNDEKRGGPSGTAAVADSSETNAPQCSFCGTVGDSKDKSGFISDHAIMKNGWCRAALMAHNALNPIKGNLEEL
jgi:phosphopantetheinyl transferase (holo-ACP synthase)